MRYKQTLACVLLAALPGVALADEVLFRENFDSLQAGRVTPVLPSRIVCWEGPHTGKLGRFQITDQFPGSEVFSSDGDRLNVLAIQDISPAINQSPTLMLPWKDRGPGSGHLLCSWDFLVPVEAPYLALFFFGNHWQDSAAAIVLSDGKILLHADKGDPSRVTIGETPGVWHTIKADLDIDARMLDLWVDGKKVASRVPWLATAPKTVDRLLVLSDLAQVDRAGAAVLYLDNIEVVSRSAK